MSDSCIITCLRGFSNCRIFNKTPHTQSCKSCIVFFNHLFLFQTFLSPSHCFKLSKQQNKTCICGVFMNNIKILRGGQKAERKLFNKVLDRHFKNNTDMSLKKHSHTQSIKTSFHCLPVLWRERSFVLLWLAIAVVTFSPTELKVTPSNPWTAQTAPMSSVRANAPTSG